jgi:hypothetical protein
MARRLAATSAILPINNVVCAEASHSSVGARTMFFRDLQRPIGNLALHSKGTFAYRHDAP